MIIILFWILKTDYVKNPQKKINIFSQLINENNNIINEANEIINIVYFCKLVSRYEFIFRQNKVIYRAIVAISYYSKIF
jgi:hypothetical protein